MKIALPCLLLVLVPTWAVRAETFQPAVRDAFEQAQADCESFEAGEFAMTEAATRRVDLTGNGRDDWVVDTSFMSCSSAASMYCGTGGCSLVFAAEGSATERIAKGWEVVEFGGRAVILLDVHGSLCGGINPTPCVEALTWDADSGSFTSLEAREE